jgi:3-phenylpropionate/trans-cinnamate dioxygenase ferredoxin reductase component
MAKNEAMVIVGAGQAGATAAASLRDAGFDGPVMLIGQEREAPYERPALSKGYLQGTVFRENLAVHQPAWYADNDVDLVLDTSVVGVDPVSHRVWMSRGRYADYRALLLTTGSSPRPLPVPGADLAGVHYLRTLQDSDRIRTVLGQASRVAVIGAGWIGLETAAAARAAGLQVTVLETAALPLLRVLGPEVAGIFASLHRDHGVDVRCGVQVAEITGQYGQADGVRLGDGSLVAADAVIVGAGILPNTRLAAGAGLSIDNGIRVDAHLRSSNPDIYAAGDVANAFHPVLGRHIRVEHWANAVHQPQTAAHAMVGLHASYQRLPYFFTDQYDLGMEYTGHVQPGGYDQVVLRGDVQAREFVAFWLSRGRVLAGMNVNVWDVTTTIESIILAGRPVDTAKLGDPDAPLESLV